MYDVQYFIQACMKGSLAKARVVYAPVEEIDGEGRLLRACSIHVFCHLSYFNVLVGFFMC